MRTSAIMTILLPVCLAITVMSSCNQDDNDVVPLLISDEFNGTTLHENWNWQNEPGTWDIGVSNNGFVTLTGEYDANIWCDDESNLLYQEINEDGDFDVSVRLIASWNGSVDHVAGLLFKFPADNDWVDLKLWNAPEWERHIGISKEMQRLGQPGTRVHRQWRDNGCIPENH